MATLFRFCIIAALLLIAAPAKAQTDIVDSAAFERLMTVEPTRDTLFIALVYGKDQAIMGVTRVLAEHLKRGVKIEVPVSSGTFRKILKFMDVYRKESGTIRMMSKKGWVMTSSKWKLVRVNYERDKKRYYDVKDSVVVVKTPRW